MWWGTIFLVVLGCGRGKPAPPVPLGGVATAGNAQWRIVSADVRPVPGEGWTMVDRDWEGSGTSPSVMVRVRLSLLLSETAELATVPRLRGPSGNLYHAKRRDEFVSASALDAVVPAGAQRIGRATGVLAAGVWHDLWAVFVVPRSATRLNLEVFEGNTRWFPNKATMALPPLTLDSSPTPNPAGTQR